MTSELSEFCDPGIWAAVVGAIDAPTCEAIADLCRSLEEGVPTVVGQEHLPTQRVGRARRVERSQATESIYNMIWEVGGLINQRHFRLDLSGIEKAPEYVEYPAGKGHFDWHNDYGLERPISRRKLTISIQLSEEGEYSGGDFLVFGTAGPLPKPLGTVIALPAYVHHRVTPVTRGTRRALVAWLAGPALR